MRYSIITVNYNNKEGLRKTIESVVHQTYRDFEFIVIDGGSTDGSIDILKEYDQQINYWVSEKDSGIYNAMNKGIKKAIGDYLNFMNSGDCFYQNDVLETVNSKKSTADMIVGRDYHFDIVSKQGFTAILPPRLSMLTFVNDTLPHQSTFFKKELFNESLYDETLRYAADMKFYLQKICVDQCSVLFIDDIICQREPNGISMINLNKCKEEYKTIVKGFLPAGAIKDYETIHLLDKSTMYKLMGILEDAKCRKWLTYCIKIIHRMFQ